MVSLFFGLPGCGKSTLLTHFAFKYSNLKKYKHIYSNMLIKVPNVTYIDNEVIGYYDLSNSLILIDEATLFADSRDYANFKKPVIQFFLEHRHYNCDIYLFTQQWDGVDRKIRVITDRVYYVRKTPLLGHWFTTYYRVPYGISIPKRDDTHAAKFGEIVQGYFDANFLARTVFANRIFRPRYYKYFDSWERAALPPLSDYYKKKSLSLSLSKYSTRVT